MYCIECGEKSGPSDRFCAGCGKELYRPTVVATTSASQALAAGPGIDDGPMPDWAAPVPSRTVLTDTGPVGVGGWLLFLVIVLGVLGPMINLGHTATAVRDLAPLRIHFPSVGTMIGIVIALTLVTVLWMVFVAYHLAKRHPKGALWARTYFLLAPIFLMLQWLTLIGIGSSLPPEFNSGVNQAMGTEMSRAIFGSVIWYLYLIKSRRVRNTFPPEGEK